MNQRDIWELYAQSWGAKSAEEKQQLYTKCLEDDVVYTDPMVQTRGKLELLETMLGFHQQIPGGNFETMEYLTHNQLGAIRWNMKSDTGEIIGNGMSFCEFSHNGLLRRINGFYEIPEPVAEQA